MNFAAFGALAKRSGAIFLRRSFKHDAVYKLVLQHYIDYLVAQRVPLSWSIEGTRSRTGMLMPPKLGLIQWVLDAYRRVSCDDVLLVPVAISFDQIAEIDDYVAMQRGLPKRKESLKWFVDYVAGMRVPHGRIFVRFAEPVGLADNVDVSASLLHGESAQIQVQKLAFAVCNRIQRVKPITPIDLLALILLAANGRPLELKQIQDHLLAALAVINDRGLPTAERLDGNDRDGLQAHLSAMIATGLVGELRESATPAYVTTPGQQLAAAYYRNTIAHYFLNGAVAEVALASVSDAPCEQAFWANVMRLRDLLKFDFFFEKKDSFRTDIARLMDHRYPDWRSRANKSFNARPPLFGHSILRSFFATYHIVAALLVARDGASIPAQDRDTMARACLRLGEEILIRGQLSTATALSLPLLENAIRLADYRQLLQGTAEQLRAARAEFATEVERANAALSQLQEAYDIGFKAG
jgi:glycerol-3-phosphate O-acyltransferase